MKKVLSVLVAAAVLVVVAGCNKTIREARGTDAPVLAQGR